MLVRYHGRLTREQAYQKDAQAVFGDYMARFGDDWKNFPLDGARYLKDDFLEAKDLDLFGKGSLYQFICTAGTLWGQDRLALWLGLSCRDFTRDDAPQVLRKIRSRQQAVAELAGKPEFCMELETRARRLRSIGYEKSAEIMDTFFQALGDVEALISLGVICHTRSVHCLPEFADCGHPVLAAADLRHPLLKGNLAVGNDVELTRRVCIITGSNMSGKTTFMRSIGVNLALACAGGFCTAGSLRVSLMKLCTSIRTEDNVHEGISTFYAELLRVKRMIEASEKQIPMISLIDEIYKGTNSKDRIFAAKETIRKLSKPWSFTLLTTHDFELCDLEHDAESDAGNYYFTEHYEDNQICFDYKLRDGRATTTNARYLLRMAGIIS